MHKQLKISALNKPKSVKLNAEAINNLCIYNKAKTSLRKYRDNFSAIMPPFTSRGGIIAEMTVHQQKDFITKILLNI